MTTVEAGVAIGRPYPKHEERVIAIHEAGHAVCGHLFMENRLSSRLSIRKRGSSGGHHQAMEIEDRFGHWRSEEVGDLIGASARWRPSTSSTARTRPAWAATSDGDRARGAHGRLPRDGAGGDRPRRPDRGPEERARRPRSGAMKSASGGSAQDHAPLGGGRRKQPVRATLGDPDSARWWKACWAGLVDAYKTV